MISQNLIKINYYKDDGTECKLCTEIFINDRRVKVINYAESPYDTALGKKINASIDDVDNLIKKRGFSGKHNMNLIKKIYHLPNDTPEDIVKCFGGKVSGDNHYLKLFYAQDKQTEKSDKGESGC